jgi:hypothetical protein
LQQICITDTDYHHFRFLLSSTKIPLKWKRNLTGVKVLVIKNGLWKE